MCVVDTQVFDTHVRGDSPWPRRAPTQDPSSQRSGQPGGLGRQVGAGARLSWPCEQGTAATGATLGGASGSPGPRLYSPSPRGSSGLLLRQPHAALAPVVRHCGHEFPPALWKPGRVPPRLAPGLMRIQAPAHCLRGVERHPRVQAAGHPLRALHWQNSPLRPLGARPHPRKQERVWVFPPQPIPLPPRWPPDATPPQPCGPAPGASTRRRRG